MFCKVTIKRLLCPERTVLIVLSLLLLFSPSSLSAEEGYDDILSGFEDVGSGEGDAVSGMAPQENDTGGVASEPLYPFYQLRGFLHFGTSVNISRRAPRTGETDLRGLQKLQTKLNLEFDVHFNEKWKLKSSGLAFYDGAYALHGRRNYTDQVLQFNEAELRLYNLYLSGTLSSSVDVRVGRQIVVWGKSDNFRVTDVLNPMDFREPGLTDIKDLRLPVTMTKLDYYTGNWDFSAILIPEIRFNLNAAFGSDFALSPSFAPYEEQPPNGLSRAEFAFAANGVFSGWDISFYYANIYNDTPHLVFDKGRLTQRHSRLNMLGGAVNIASGNMLYKGEVAYFNGLRFFSLPQQRKERLDILLGFEYSGFTDTTVSFDIVNRHLFGFREVLRSAPDDTTQNRFQSSLRISRDFLNQQLNVLYYLTVNGATGQEGAFHRLSAEYEYSDHITVTGGILNFFSGNQLYSRALKDADRLFFNIHYTF